MPHRFKMRNEMHESFMKTSKCSDIIFDDRIDLNLTQILNDQFRKNPDYEYYHVANDDILYLTDGWDRFLIDSLDRKCGGIAFGDDGMQASNLCTFPMISGYIVRALGWLQYPNVIHFFADNIWYDIGSSAKCLYYAPKIKIDHRHWLNQKREQDDPKYNDKYSHDMDMYYDWCDGPKYFDVQRVVDAKKLFVKEKVKGIK
jgi:hypothetical protein